MGGTRAAGKARLTRKNDEENIYLAAVVKRRQRQAGKTSVFLSSEEWAWPV